MNIVLLLLWHTSFLSFTVAISNSSINSRSQFPSAFDVLVDNGTYGYYPTATYVTEPGLDGPRTNFLSWDERCDDSLLYFLTPRGWGLPTPGPMILDKHGKLVWTKHFDNAFGGQAYNLMVQTYNGEEYLTFWLGDDRVRGHGTGSYYMLNSSYDIVHSIGSGAGLSADLHEFIITPEGTALMISYEVAQHDLTLVPGYDPDERSRDPTYIWDCVFREVDIASGQLVFEWRTSEHISMANTYRHIGPGSKSDPFDWSHLNSIEKDEPGNYLVSARYLHSISYIDGETGDIIWTLGGKSNDFMDLSGGNATNFAWQHDARFVPTDAFPNTYSPPKNRKGFTTKLLTLFDNAAEDGNHEYGLTYSRGLLLEISFPSESRKSKSGSSSLVGNTVPDGVDLNVWKFQETNGKDSDYTVRVLVSYENPSNVRSSSQGSLQTIPQYSGQDAKVLVGYGLNAVWTEFEGDGTVLCDAHYGATTSWERGDIQSYRTFKFDWVGAPSYPPKAEISNTDSAVIFASWNGATEVVDWILQCSTTDTDDEKFWEDLIRVGKSDFETSIIVPAGSSYARYLRVIAIDKDDRLLKHGTSNVMDRGMFTTYSMSITGKLPLEVTRVTPLAILLALTIMVSTIVVFLKGCRRCLLWRYRRRQGVLYRAIRAV